MAVNVKMGVDLGAFKEGIDTAKSAVKTFDEQLKLIKATLEATGDAETALQQTLETLSAKISAQESVVAVYEEALKQLKAYMETKAGKEAKS